MTAVVGGLVLPSRITTVVPSGEDGLVHEVSL
jgi:hypothetical protein